MFITAIEISQLAKEVANLPGDSRPRQGFLGLMLSTVHSLTRAQQLDFQSRTGAALAGYTNEMIAIANELADGRITESGPWLAGFYFNSALIRLAAGFDRALKALYPKDNRGCQKLANRAIKDGLICEDQIDYLREIYRDINQLKHGSGVLLDRRRIETLPQAIQAAQQLLNLIRLAIR